MASSTVIMAITSPNSLTITPAASSLQLISDNISGYQKKEVSESGIVKVASITPNRNREFVFKVHEMPYWSSPTQTGWFTNGSYYGLYTFIASALYADFHLNPFNLTIPQPDLASTDFLSATPVRYWSGLESVECSPTSERFNGTLVFRAEVV